MRHMIKDLPKCLSIPSLQLQCSSKPNQIYLYQFGCVKRQMSKRIIASVNEMKKIKIEMIYRASKWRPVQYKICLVPIVSCLWSWIIIPVVQKMLYILILFFVDKKRQMATGAILD